MAAAFSAAVVSRLAKEAVVNALPDEPDVSKEPEDVKPVSIKAANALPPVDAVEKLIEDHEKKAASNKRKKSRKAPPAKLPPEAVKSEKSGSARVVDKALVQKILKNPQPYIRDIRVRKLKKKGELKGYRFTRLPPSSILGRLGFMKGDVVRSVNGIKIRNPDEALAAYGKLKDSRSFRVHLKRDDCSVTLEIHIR